MIVLCLLAATVGFTGLCLGTPRHQRDVLGRVLSPFRTRLYKTLGWIALALSFGLAVARDGAALGLVYWVGALTLAALVVALSTTWLSRR
jgi:hypothetical protein